MHQMKDRQNLDEKYLGGPFDRQVRIEEWDQDVIKKQAVLVLGIGGLGSVVVTSLLRLGVGRVFMVDYDVVDVHNLNRQILYSTADVGKPKVEAAFANAQFHKAGDTQIQIFHGNALTNWETIVAFAKRSTFAYNCIDWGDKFDIAVASLCLSIGIPLVMGGTFSTSMTIDFFPHNGRPCYLCSETITEPPEFWDKVKPDVIISMKDLSFLPKNNNPIGRSSIAVCTICGEIMVAHLLNWLFLSEERPYKASRIIFYHNTFQIVKFDIERFKKCPYCVTPQQIAEEQKREQEEKRQAERKKQEEQAKKEAEKKEIQTKQETQGKAETQSGEGKTIDVPNEVNAPNQQESKLQLRENNQECNQPKVQSQ